MNIYSLGFHAVNDVRDPVIQQFNSLPASHSVPVLKFSIIIMKNRHEKKKKKKTAMHDSDFAYQSKWEFYSVNPFRSS